MEERTGEISVHRDILKAELKALNEEKHRYVRYTLCTSTYAIRFIVYVFFLFST